MGDHLPENRAVFFIDGNNWYHGCRDIGLDDLGRLDYVKICRKLAGSRTWIGARYYIGRVPARGNPRLAVDQQRFMSRLLSADARFTAHYGRIEPRPAKNEAAMEIKRYLATLTTRIDPEVYRQLVRIANTHAMTSVMVEKAVDVQIAVDMVVMAERDEFETAYLLSADGDLTPAVEATRAKGKKVLVASPSSGARLAAACNSYIRLPRAWFTGLFTP